MNFTDTHPHSFLDYAWTCPTPPSLQTAGSLSTYPRKQTREHKTTATRKQNRSCDQCRKGKRACNAAILEDALLGGSSVGKKTEEGANGLGYCEMVDGVRGGVTAFHYSDVYGSLARCGNCEKTRKTCTFEWLRSQRVLQARQQLQNQQQLQKQANNAPSPPKKRRTRSSALEQNPRLIQKDGEMHAFDSSEEQGGGIIDAIANTPVGQSLFASLQQSLADWFTGLLPSLLEYDASSVVGHDSAEEAADSSSSAVVGLDVGWWSPPKLQNSESVSDSSQGFTRESHQDVLHVGPEGNEDVKERRDMVASSSKKRRRQTSSSTDSASLTASSSTSVSSDKMLGVNKILLTEALLKIYRESFENHLCCWLTEKTCPVNNRSVNSSLERSRPDWKYVYHQVFQLDRLPLVRGKEMSRSEEKATAKALNLAIFAFASQWMSSTGAADTKFPYGAREYNKEPDTPSSRDFEPNHGCFNRDLQIAIWNQARLALAEVEGFESFRVALALIVFSLTQKPHTVEDGPEIAPDCQGGESSPSQLENEFGRDFGSSPPPLEREAVEECSDMLSQLNLLIAGEGPPLHLEKGLRLLHTLKSRITVAGTLQPSASKRRNGAYSASQVEGADKEAIDLLFWLAMMFDTLSSAMHKRPLVVSPEDSEFPINHRETGGQETYDDFLFGHQASLSIRWPCSNEVAKSLLCSAAPIKVLLFRKVTLLQSQVSRGVQGKKMENAIKDALQVYEHWQKMYEPFFQDAFQNHDALPLRLRAWSICLAGHWHLATLLLADLMEIIDDSGLGMASRRRSRCQENVIADMRKRNCQSVSDIARCACPKERDSANAHQHVDSTLAQETLLTEPWTLVLIRAFATASVHLLESTAVAADCEEEKSQEDSFGRADDCIQALWYLGRKAHMATKAARMLGDALRQRRRWAVERASRLDSLVEQWADFDQLNGSFETGCL